MFGVRSLLLVFVDYFEASPWGGGGWAGHLDTGKRTTHFDPILLVNVVIASDIDLSLKHFICVLECCMYASLCTHVSK